MFYGREHQKKSLLDMIKKEEQMITLIYGRRRIGKSELIKQSLKESDVQSIYYECKQTTEQNNVDSLAEIIADIFDFPKPSFSNIEALVNSKSLWKCLSCFACVERCPRNVKPGALIDAARQVVIRQKDADYLKPHQVPELLDEDVPQQLLMSVFRRYRR